jgi:hypothetical protein
VPDFFLKLILYLRCAHFFISLAMGDLSHPADAIELPDPQALLRNDSGHRDFSNVHGRSDILEIPPEHAVSALPAWNQNRANVFKTFSTFSAFIIMGANDAAYGVSD